MTEGQNFMELVKEKWTSLGGRGGEAAEVMATKKR